MNDRAPQDFKLDVAGKMPWARRKTYTYLGKNLNREPWSETLDILNSVGSGVNPVFCCFEGQLVDTCPPVRRYRFSPCGWTNPTQSRCLPRTGKGLSPFRSYTVVHEWNRSPPNPMPPQRQNEDSLIRKIAHRWLVPHSVPGQSVVLGIGDDAALLRPKSGQDIILTCDWFLEGTHFLRDQHPPDSVGWKCLARALSDIAAMGGTPRCFLLILALPQKLTGRWLDLFLGGLRRASRKFQCPLPPAHTPRHNKVLINLSIFGQVPTRHAVRPSGAPAGDIPYVTC